MSGEAAVNESGFVQRNVLITPNAIANYWQEGKKPLHYFKRWRFLTLTLHDYKFVHAYHASDFDTTDELDDIFKQEDFRKRLAESFESLTEEEQKAFRWAHEKQVKPPTRSQTVTLTGWAQIEPSRSIEVFSVDVAAKKDTVKYKRTFRRVDVTIQEWDKLRVGSLMHWTESLRRYDEDEVGEDYLRAEMYVPEGTLSAMEKKMGEKKVPLVLAVRAHLFQYEVDESLAEPYHPQTYSMLHDSSASIALGSIMVGRTDEVRQKPGDEEATEEVAVSEERAPSALAQPSFESLIRVGKHIRAALWTVAVLLGVMILAR